jgi:hypothetical protein
MLALMATRGAAGARRLGHHVREQRYGGLLVLILGSVVFQLASPDSDLARAITLLLQAATLLVAVRVSHARALATRVFTAFVLVVLAVAAGTTIATGEIGDAAARLLSLLILVLVPPLVAVGTIRTVREEGVVSVHTIFGVLCLYVLVGALFAFAYGGIDALSSTPFFAQETNAEASDFLYFSFTALTTTGFGDLTAATDLGRSLVIAEELIGQIYLVTVVAVIVGNLGRPRPARRRA